MLSLSKCEKKNFCYSVRITGACYSISTVQNFSCEKLDNSELLRSNYRVLLSLRNNSRFISVNVGPTRSQRLRGPTSLHSLFFLKNREQRSFQAPILVKSFYSTSQSVCTFSYFLLSSFTSCLVLSNLFIQFCSKSCNLFFFYNTNAIIPVSFLLPLVPNSSSVSSFTSPFRCNFARKSSLSHLLF